jgi:predicted dehydrogenase
VLDLMIHDIDLVLWLAGSEVVEVTATGAAVLGPHEDLAHAHLRFANGCLASLNASRTSFRTQRTMQIFGQDAYAGVDFASGTTRVVRPTERLLRRDIDVRKLSAEERRLLQERLFTDVLQLEEVQIEKRNAILDEQHDFVISIRTGQKPQVTGEHGRAALAVAEAILEQISEQQRTTRRVPTLQGPHWDLTPQGAARRQRKAG